MCRSILRIVIQALPLLKPQSVIAAMRLINPAKRPFRAATSFSSQRMEIQNSMGAYKS